MATTERRAEAIWIEKKKYWQVKVQKDGERKAFTSSTPGRKGKHEAEAKADEWLETGATDMRFSLAWAQYLTTVKDTTGQANYENRESIGRIWLMPTLKNKRLSAITQQNMQECINAAGKAGKSKRLCINIRAALVSFCRYARTCRWKLEQPFGLTIPRNTTTKERNILQPGELKTLFTRDTITRYGKERPAFFIWAWRFAVVLGLRRGELCGLKWTDLNNGVLHIDRAINNLGIETRGKNENARRYIALPQIAIRILDAQRANLRTAAIVSPWMFPDEHGERLDSNHLYKCWAKYRAQHGLHSSLHELRHTFVSIVKSDMPVALLKAMVGHSDDMDTLGVYGQAVDGDMTQTAAIIDNVFNRLIPSK